MLPEHEPRGTVKSDIRIPAARAIYFRPEFRRRCAGSGLMGTERLDAFDGAVVSSAVEGMLEAMHL